MTMTMHPGSNGRTDRRSLASEIDRFDRMIDGLDKAIPAAVAEAVKESVAMAVAEAFRVTLFELISDANIQKLLREVRSSAESGGSQATTAVRSTSPLQRLRQSIASALRSTCRRVKVTIALLTSPIRTFAAGTVLTYQQLTQVWSLRKPLTVSLVVGVIVGAVGYASAPWLAGLLAGGGAVTSTLLGQFAAWIRRVHATLTMG